MELVDQVKAAADIVQVVGEYVRLRRAGAGPRYTGLCPFHTEKTPSFSVHSAHQFYKCFGCGAGGDMIKFVMEMERLTFWEALKLLAEKHGIPLPKRSELADEESRQRARMTEMHEAAARSFEENLWGPAGAEARAYLERRGLRQATAREFGLGLSDRGGQTLVRLLERRGYTGEEAEAAGLLLRRQDGSGFFDRFRGRLMFPIQSESGKVIGFGGRALAAGDEPKYLNSPETPIYRKSQVLYNLHRAKEGIRKAGFSILVEGYMDVIGVAAAGIGQVAASCGTALTSLQVRALKRHADNVVVNFDPDAAGANATERSIQTLIEEGLRVRVLQLEGGLDPDEFIKERGVENYTKALGRARGYFHWLADRARGRFDMRTPEGRVQAFQFLLPAIHRMPDKLERVAVANDVADYLGVPAGYVLDEFRKAAAERREKAPLAAREEPLEANDVLLVNALLGSAEAREEALPLLGQLRILEQSPARRIFEAIARAAEADGELRFSDVEGRLGETDQALLARLVFANAEAGGTTTVEQAVECARRLAHAEHDAGVQDLRRAIKDAERAGNMAEALRLMECLNKQRRVH